MNAEKSITVPITLLKKNILLLYFRDSPFPVFNHVKYLGIRQKANTPKIQAKNTQ